ncbi:tetratricopeptide repeat protein [Gramella sp. GC03-9]|uniref:Tetratricopeptide repeat protein n=1 Tax=Christiangramia oceanisediminis TaxID=2920386 RepID=A0A9X2I0P2_9FLAO|nr:tetratricopeptide repeat protein [Gramella oceanisediminis]MCP9198776.1 tetratricopeptide repeat protein [Gramella oceanisediminis]
MSNIKRHLFIIGLLAQASLCFSQTEILKTADSLSAVGETTKAVELLKSIEPKTESVYLKLAKIQQASRQNEEALQNYKTVLDQSPGKILTAVDYGELLLETGKADMADSLFTELSKKYPENAAFMYRIGLAKEMKKDSTAMRYFFKTHSWDSTHQGAIYKTAKYFLKNGKSYNAIMLCNTGLRARPNNVSLLSILGQSYSKTLQFEKAIEPYEKLISLGEGSEFILEKLAKSYRVTGQDEKAIETYTKMLEINDANASVHSNLGVLYLNQNKPDKAQQHFTMALLIKKQPVDNEYVNIGLSFKRQENFQEAYRNFKMALGENPENQRALIELAIAADAIYEDKEKVLKYYQDFVDKYAETGRNDMLSIAEYRISQLKKEIHMAK